MHVGFLSTGRSFSKGEAVLYLTKDKHYVAATVAAVDTSVIPPAYTITFDDDPNTFRDTDGPRLRPVAASQDKHLDSQGSKCPAPCCQSIITAGQLQVWEVLLLCLPAKVPELNLPALRKGWQVIMICSLPAVHMFGTCLSIPCAMNGVMKFYLVQHTSHNRLH